MEGSAPKEILHYVDKQTQQLHEVVADEATKGGHPATPQSVNPNDQSSLEGVRQTLDAITHDATHVVGSTISNDEAAKNRLTRKKAPIPIIAGRWLKRRLLEKEAA